MESIKTFKIANPDITCCLCLQSAAWALGLADRVPSKCEIAFPEVPRSGITQSMYTYRYKSNINTVPGKDVDCLAPESIIVHIAEKPAVIRSWNAALEWIPDVVFECEKDRLLAELTERNDSVKRRCGYFLQGMFPDAADHIYQNINIKSKIRFCPRQSSACINK